jgi:hypothetical protein
MTRKKPTKVSSAQTKANITALLTSSPTKHTGHEVGDALGISHGSAGQYLALMAKQGLISVEGKGLKRLYWIDVYPKATNRVKGVTAAAGKRISKAVNSGKEVELVVGGTAIVIGRNPSTGRLRITLEDVQ